MRATPIVLMSGICVFASQNANAWVVNPLNGNSYALMPPMTWHDARDHARSLGGELVTIRSQAENDWLMQTFWSQRTSGSIWIGLTDELVEGDWRWVSGEPVTFTNWWSQGGSPNNAPTSPTGEDYAQLFEIPANGMWDDYPSPTYTQLGSGTAYPLLNNGVVELIPSPSGLAIGLGPLVLCLRRRR